MLGYLARRLVLAIVTIWAISVLSFVIILLPPGDWVDTYIEHLSLGSMGLMTDEDAEALREEYGLNKPLYHQYYRWISRMARGNFGFSIYLQVPVKDIFAERIPYTIMLAGVTVLFTWVLAIPIGIYSAVRQHSVGDYAFTFVGFIGLAVPDFLLALVLMYVAMAFFRISVGGFFSLEYISAPWSLGRVWNLLSHLWIPALVLGTSGTAALVRVMRNNLLDEISKPYVVTARAKGLRGWRVIVKYPVRLAINPLISTAGYLLPYLIGGSVIVSVVLSLPTLGPVLLRALLEQETFIAGTVVFMLGTFTVIGTLLSDVLLVIVDPRIKIVRSAE